MNMDLMPSNSGFYYFFGGLLLVLGGILEFILGNTFPSVVFSSYGAFFLSFAATLQPFYYAYGLYAPAGQPELAGLDTVGFNSSFAFFLVFIAILSFVFLILSIRTNVVFVIIFFTLVIFFGLLSGVYWQSANGIGNSDPSALTLAHRLQVVSLIPFTIHYPLRIYY
jgi:succinate-acetate transporter protein